jgi:hypothetical protein
LSVHRQAELAACGAWALKELQRLCAMAKAPPTGGLIKGGLLKSR